MPARLLINDLARHNGPLDAEIRAAIDRVLARGWYILGPEVEAFEAEFSAYCGTGHCIGVGNGTDALEIALRALEIGPGDDVATVANAGMYATAAIRAVGATPCYIDIDWLDMLMSAESLANRLTPRTRAVIVTHLYGKLADMTAIDAIADAHGIPVIEDCAQAHGASRLGRRAGSFGAIGCFSFYPTKNLGALGDGGAIVTSDSLLAERARRLRQYGWSRRYVAETAGGRNSRLDEMQAAILRAKLPHLDRWNRARRRVANGYVEAFRDLPVLQAMPYDEDHAAHLFVLRAPWRDDLREALAAQAIATDIHYPLPDFQQPIFAGAEFERPPLPFTTASGALHLTLPCFPEMEQHEVSRVAEAVTAFYAQRMESVGTGTEPG